MDVVKEVVDLPHGIVLSIVMAEECLTRFKLIRLRRISLATLPRYGRRDGRKVDFINIKDMYNNDTGQGGVRVYEAYES
jgi:hypothetical protein